MASISCKCEQVIELRTFPNPYTCYFMEESELLEFIENTFSSLLKEVQAGNLRLQGDDTELEPDLSYRLLTSLMGSMSRFYECPNCGRLILFRQGADHRRHYSPDREDEGE
jgi:hypothetical protein